jgi:hypothetical protein
MRQGVPSGLALVTLAASSALSGEERQQQQSRPAESQLICRAVHETGSRLKARRVCMTSAEWAEQRRQDWMLIERSQVHACTPGAGC